MKENNIFYAQSGGATAVINSSACGVIETARRYPQDFGTVFAGKNGILGALHEELIDTHCESAAAIAGLKHTPACAFGSCRYKLKDFETDKRQYERLISVFQAHDIRYFIYNGGGDSQDTAYKVSHMADRMGYPLVCIGIPKTIDNDLPITDNSPGFGSVAKYVAISTQEAALDVRSMAATSTKVFILEVMGRHAGWIAAASGLGQQTAADAPHLILFPEITFNRDAFLERVKLSVNDHGYCVVVASEGIKNAEGKFLTESSTTVDAFGHTQLGGVAPLLAHTIQKHLGFKQHYAIADYLQRAARHIASQTDVDQAYALGVQAVEHARRGQKNIMLTVIRRTGERNEPYTWEIGHTPLNTVANIESKMPAHFIDSTGFHITAACKEYLRPLIQGEAYPPYVDGLPQYVTLQNKLVAAKLPPFGSCR